MSKSLGEMLDFKVKVDTAEAVHSLDALHNIQVKTADTVLGINQVYKENNKIVDGNVVAVNTYTETIKKQINAFTTEIITVTKLQSADKEHARILTTKSEIYHDLAKEARVLADVEKQRVRETYDYEKALNKAYTMDAAMELAKRTQLEKEFDAYIKTQLKERKQLEKEYDAYTAAQLKERLAIEKVAAAERKRFEDESLASFLADQKRRLLALQDEAARKKAIYQAMRADEQAQADRMSQLRETLTRSNNLQGAYVGFQRELPGLSGVKTTTTTDAATQKLTTSVTGLNAAGQKVSATYTTVNGNLRAFTKTLADQEKQVAASASTTNGLVSSVGRLIKIYVGYRVLNLVTTQLRESITEAIELQKRIAEIQTISQDAPQTFAQWAEQIRSVSDAFGFTTKDTAAAFYETISNQIAKGTEVLEFNTAAAKFAISTNSTLADSVDVLSSALNAYGLSADYADVFAAKMFRTIDLGRITASEMAGTLGSVTVVAGQLGISLDEVNAVLAQTSIKGLNAHRTMTQLRGLMTSFLKPTKEMKKFLDELGYSTGEEAIAALRLSGIVKELSKYSKDNSEIIAKLVPRMQGLVAAITSFSNEGENYAVVLEKIQSANEDYLKATEIAANSAGRKVSAAMQAINNTFINDFGNPVVLKLGEMIGDTELFAVKVKLVGTAVVEVGKLFAGVFSNIPTLKAGGLLLSYLTEDLKALIELRREVNKASDAIKTRYVDETLAAQQANKDILGVELQRLATIRKAWAGSTAANVEALEEIGAKSKETFKRVADSINDNVKAFTTGISDTEKRITKLRDDTKSLISDIKDTAFETQLGKQDPNKQVQTLLAEVKRTNALRLKAVAAGQSEEAVLLLKKQKKLVDDLIKLDTKRVDDVKEAQEKLVELDKDRKTKLLENAKTIRDAQQKGDGNAVAIAVRERQIVIAETAKQQGELEKIITTSKDKTTGTIKEGYVKLYAGLLVLAQKQEADLSKIEENRINVLKNLEMAAAVQVSVFKEKLKTFEAQDFSKELAGAKSKDDVTKLADDRKKVIDALLAQTNLLADGESRNSALKEIARLREIEAANVLDKLRTVELDALSAKLQLITEIKNARLEEARIARTTAQEDIRLTRLQLLTNQSLESSETDRDKRRRLIQKVEAGKQLIQQQEAILAAANEAFKALSNVEEASKIAQEAKVDAQQKQLDLLREEESIKARILQMEGSTTVKKADGGMAYGSDSVKAMLSPGEFVVNSASSRKFYSQLVGMNSRNNSLRMADGGRVNVGDININMTSSGSESYDVQRLGRSLRREIRRGTVKF